MAKNVIIQRVLGVWKIKCVKEYDGGSGAESMDIVVDMDEDATGGHGPEHMGVSLSSKKRPTDFASAVPDSAGPVQCPPAIGSTGAESPRPSALACLSLPSAPPAVESISPNYREPPTVNLLWTQHLHSVASANLDNPGLATGLPTAAQLPTNTASVDSRHGLFSDGHPSTTSLSNVAAAGVDNRGQTDLSPAPTQPRPYLAVSVSPDLHGPSTVNCPFKQYPHDIAAAYPDNHGLAKVFPNSARQELVETRSAGHDHHRTSAVFAPSTVSPPTAESANSDHHVPSSASHPSTQSSSDVSSADLDNCRHTDVFPPRTQSPSDPAVSLGPVHNCPSAANLPPAQSASCVPSTTPGKGLSVIVGCPGSSAEVTPSTDFPAVTNCIPRVPIKRTMLDNHAQHTKRRLIFADSDEVWNDINNKDEEPRRFPFCPRRTPGVQLDLQKDYSPLELFQLFFSKDVVRTLCQNTNKNIERMRQRGLQSAVKLGQLDPGDILKYISLVLYLGLVRPSVIRDLWRRDLLHVHPFPASVMPGYKFDTISALLHMSDPTADVVNDRLRGHKGYDRLFRVKPLQDQILTACRSYYHPYQNLSIDERMVAAKNQSGMKQYMKAKPIRWGFKLFVLADSKSGYTCDFTLYQGKTFHPSGNGLSYDAVVNLLRVPHLGTGYNVFVDNFYTSTALFRYLQQIRYGACGTMREKLTCFPKTTANALPPKARRGDMRWIRRGPLLYVKWKDNKEVCMCSTIHKAYSGQMAERVHKGSAGQWSKHSIPVPDPVVEYNKYMGGVDLSDALIKYYNVNRKTMRWYKKLFLHFVDIAVVNCYIIQKELALIKGRRPLTQKRFREALCLQLGGVSKENISLVEYKEAVAMGKQPEVKAETEQQEVAAEGDQQEVAAEGEQQEVAAEGDQQEVAAEGEQQEVAAEGEQQEVAAERGQQEAAVEGEQDEVAAEGGQQEVAAGSRRKRQEVATGSSRKQQEVAVGRKRQDVAAERTRQEVAAKRKKQAEAVDEKLPDTKWKAAVLSSCFPVTTIDVHASERKWKATKGRKYCVLCYSQKKKYKTIYKCSACNVALCIKADRLCFTDWHILVASNKLPRSHTRLRRK